jgi:hypothetical protein
MAIHKIVVQAESKNLEFLCVLKNVEEKIYQIVNSKEENNPQSIQWNDGKNARVFFFNALKIEGENVFTFTAFSTERYKIGTLVGIVGAFENLHT